MQRRPVAWVEAGQIFRIQLASAAASQRPAQEWQCILVETKAETINWQVKVALVGRHCTHSTQWDVNGANLQNAFKVTEICP